MRYRWIIWGLASLIVIAAGLMLVPSSPWHINTVLGSKGQHEGKPTSFWVKAINSDDPKTRHDAIFALGAIGTDAADTVPLLAKIMLEDQDPFARVQASLSLTKMYPATASVVEQLAQALEDPEPAVRMNASMALFKLGKQASAATPALLKGAKDEENDNNLGSFMVTIREQMVLAVGTTSAGSEEYVKPLLEIVTTTEQDRLRTTAVRALGLIGPSARAAIPVLTALQKIPNEGLQKEVKYSLELIEAGAPAK